MNFKRTYFVYLVWKSISANNPSYEVFYLPYLFRSQWWDCLGRAGVYTRVEFTDAGRGLGHYSPGKTKELPGGDTFSEMCSAIKQSRDTEQHHQPPATQ